MDVALERGPLHAVDRDGEPVSGEEGLALQRRGGGTLLRRQSGWAARSADTRSACACAGVQVHAQVQGAAHAGTTGNWLRVALPMPPRPTCTCLRLMSSGLWPMSRPSGRKWMVTGTPSASISIRSTVPSVPLTLSVAMSCECGRAGHWRRASGARGDVRDAPH